MADWYEKKGGYATRTTEDDARITYGCYDRYNPETDGVTLKDYWNFMRDLMKEVEVRLEHTGGGY